MCVSDDVSVNSGVEYVWMCIACTYIHTYMFLLCFVLFVWCVCVVFIFVCVLPASTHHLLPSLLTSPVAHRTTPGSSEPAISS